MSHDEHDSDALWGTRIHWIWQVEQSDPYQHYAVFLCPELRHRYDDPVSALHFEEDEVPIERAREMAFDEQVEWSPPPDVASVVDAEPLRTELERHQIPRGDEVETILPGQLRDALERGAVSWLFGGILTEVPSDAGSFDDFEGLERDIRGRGDDLGGSARGGRYSGPLFLYARDELNDGATILERKAPVNVVWRRRLGRTGIDLASRMETNGWHGHYNYSRATRYAIVDGDVRTLRTHGDEGAKKAGLPLEQWHVRLVEIPTSMDRSYAVAGNVHYDPVDHGKLESYLTAVNWRFARAREEIVRDWARWGFRTETVAAGNDGEFDSSDGEIGVVKPL